MAGNIKSALMAAAAAAMAATSAIAAARRFDVKVINESHEPGKGYWVEYRINDTWTFRSDKTIYEINTLAWKAMSDEDKEKTIAAVYGVFDARSVQFGYETAEEMTKWYNHKHGWQHGKQIMINQHIEKRYPGLVERFSNDQYGGYKREEYFRKHFEPATYYGAEYNSHPDNPELDSKYEAIKYLVMTIAGTAYDTLSNAEYMRTAAAVKCTSGDLIQLIVDKCLVPGVTLPSAGGIGLLSVPDKVGTAIDYFGALTGWQDKVFQHAIGTRADPKSALKVIDEADLAITRSYALIQECVRAAHEFQKEIDERVNEWVAERDARTEEIKDDPMVKGYKDWPYASETYWTTGGSAPSPLCYGEAFPERYPIPYKAVATKAIADKLASMKKTYEDLYAKYEALPSGKDRDAAYAAYVSSYRAYQSYRDNIVSSVESRANAWADKFNAMSTAIGERLYKNARPSESDGKYKVLGEAISRFIDYGWWDVSYGTAAAADVSKVAAMLTKYAEDLEAYWVEYNDIAVEYLAMLNAGLNEGLPIYNDYLALDGHAARVGVSSLQTWRNTLGKSWEDVAYNAEPRFCERARKARSWAKVYERYAETQRLQKTFKEKHNAYLREQDRKCNAARQAFLAANAKYSSATSNVPVFVQQEKQVVCTSSFTYPGSPLIGNRIDSNPNTTLGKAFLDPNNPASLAAANGYAEQLTVRLEAFNTVVVDRSQKYDDYFYQTNLCKHLTSYYNYAADRYHGNGGAHDGSGYSTPLQDMSRTMRLLQQDFVGHPYGQMAIIAGLGQVSNLQKELVSTGSYPDRYGKFYQSERAVSEFGSSSVFPNAAVKKDDGAKLAANSVKAAGIPTLNDGMGRGSFAYHANGYYKSINAVTENPKQAVRDLINEVYENCARVRSGEVDGTWTLRLHRNDGSTYVTNFFGAYGVPERVPTVDDLEWHRPGYKFKGWGSHEYATVVACKPASCITNFTAHGGKKEYYAIWTFAGETHKLFVKPNGGRLSGAVFGDANGKEATATLTMTVGKATNATIGRATRTGYKFRGWYDQEEGGRKVFDADGKAMKNGMYWDAKGNWKFEDRVFVYAQFDLDPNAYMIRFHKNDGTGLTREVAFIYGTAKAMPTCANGLGWTSAGLFKGWATSRVNAAKGIVWKGDAATVSTAAAKGKTLDVYAVWERAYNIRFHKQDGTGATYVRKYTSGYKSPLPKYSASLGWARRGFKFKGWATSASSTKVWKADGAYVSAATTAGKTLDVYAVWELDPNYYCIYFIRNDGAGTWRKVAYLPGTQYWLPSLSDGLGWARRGYTFKGWATSTANARAGKVWKGDAAKFKDAAAKGKTLTVYAIWQLTSGYYQIAFHKNDGTGKWRSLGYQYGKSTRLPTCAKGLGWGRSGYVFRGWATSAANAKAGKIWKADGAWVATAAAKGKTLDVYAVWKAGETVSANGTAPVAANGAAPAAVVVALRAARAAAPSPAADGLADGDDALAACVVTGPIADGSGEYAMELGDAGRGWFCVEAEDCSFAVGCEAAKYGEYILVTLDDGGIAVIAPDGTAELL